MDFVDQDSFAKIKPHENENFKYFRMFSKTSKTVNLTICEIVSGARNCEKKKNLSVKILVYTAVIHSKGKAKLIN